MTWLLAVAVGVPHELPKDSHVQGSGTKGLCFGLEGGREGVVSVAGSGDSAALPDGIKPLSSDWVRLPVQQLPPLPRSK